ncbi:hypothetical protein ACFL2B_00430 [Patescibacteria group bacterium]
MTKYQKIFVVAGLCVAFAAAGVLASPGASADDVVRTGANNVFTGVNSFPNITIGAPVVGGVTYFNGTIINETKTDDGEDIPVTFGDNVRVDGIISRGEDASKPVWVTGGMKIEGDIEGIDISDVYNLQSVLDGKIDAGNVTASDIVDNAVTNSKIADGAVNSEKIENGSITGSDIDTNTGVEIGHLTINRDIQSVQSITMTEQLIQASSMDGAMKAMVYVTSIGEGGNCSVVRDFNSQHETTTCSYGGTGLYDIDFGFSIGYRYWVVSPVNSTGGVPTASLVNQPAWDTLQISTMDSTDGSQVDSDFMVTLY